MAGEADAEGRIASPVFSIEYYMSRYPDLQEAYGSNRQKYVEHFLKWGMDEGRVAIASFEVKKFKEARPDLQERYGNNLKYYYFHYELYGNGEVTEIDTANGASGAGGDGTHHALTVMDGIDYSPVYDFDYYLAHNPDVKAVFGENETAVLGHFIRYGMDEGRQAKESFDVVSYRNLYGDLRAAFGSDTKAYYMHYIRWGQAEGRKTTGAREVTNPVTVQDGIDYAPVYDYNYYIAHNPDVVGVFGHDDIAVLAHFVRWGMSEGRQGNESFNVYHYREKYADVKEVYGDDLKGCYMQYLRWGIAEGRTP